MLLSSEREVVCLNLNPQESEYVVREITRRDPATGTRKFLEQQPKPLKECMQHELHSSITFRSKQDLKGDPCTVWRWRYKLSLNSTISFSGSGNGSIEMSRYYPKLKISDATRDDESFPGLLFYDECTKLIHEVREFVLFMTLRVLLSSTLHATRVQVTRSDLKKELICGLVDACVKLDMVSVWSTQKIGREQAA